MSSLWKSIFVQFSTTREGLSFPSNRNVDVVVFIKLGPASLLLGLFLLATLNSSVLFCFLFSEPSKSIRMLQFLNVATISHRTFMYHHQHYLHPTIVSVWKGQQSLYFEEVLKSRQPVRLGGDGRADTPGHSSYTTMDLEKNIVVDVQLMQLFRSNALNVKLC